MSGPASRRGEGEGRAEEQRGGGSPEGAEGREKRNEGVNLLRSESPSLKEVGCYGRAFIRTEGHLGYHLAVRSMPLLEIFASVESPRLIPLVCVEQLTTLPLPQ
jgi:hypothetical protein